MIGIIKRLLQNNRFRTLLVKQKLMNAVVEGQIEAFDEPVETAPGEFDVNIKVHQPAEHIRISMQVAKNE